MSPISLSHTAVSEAFKSFAEVKKEDYNDINRNGKLYLSLERTATIQHVVSLWQMGSDAKQITGSKCVSCLAEGGSRGTQTTCRGTEACADGGF